MNGETTKPAQYEQLEILASAGIMLMQITSEDEVYDFLADTLKKIIPGTIFIISNTDQQVKNFLVTNIVGINETMIKKVIDLLGFNPYRRKFVIEEKFVPYKEESRLWEFNGHLSELVTENFPRSISNFIQNILSIKRIFLIGIVHSKEIYGNITILTTNGFEIQDHSVIETLLYQASSTIKKIRTSNALEQSRKQYYNLFHESISGFAYHEIICNEVGKPVDYTYIDINPAFEKLTGLKREDVIGHSARELLPNLEMFWIEKYGNVALNGEAIQFENYFYDVRKYFEIKAFCPEIGKFATIFNDITDRKRAEEASHERQIKLNSVFNAAPIGIGVVKNRVIIEVNNVICKMTGYKPEELIGKNARMLYPSKEEFDFVGEEKYRQIALKGTGTVETRWLKKDGSIIYILLSSTPFDIANLSAGVTFTVVDLTERSLTERALMESEEKFRMAFLTSPDAVNINSIEDGTYLDINDGFTQISGYSREEVIGQSSLTLNIWKYPEQRDMLIRGLKEHGKVTNLNAEFVMKDGSLKHGLMSASTIMLAGKPHILSITRDITEIKEAERKIRDLNIHLEQKVAERTAQLNEAVENYKAEVIERRKIQKILEQSNYELKALNDAVAHESQKLLILNDKLFESEQNLKKLNRELELRVENRTQELKKAKELAESASQVKSIILNNLGHELRTPLNGALGFTQLLIEDLYQQDHIETARIIYNSMKRLERTLNSLLTITNIESGLQSLNSEKKDLTEFIKNLYHSYAETITSKGLEFFYYPPSISLYSEIDEQLLNSIMFNIIDNAVKFTSRGNISIRLNHKQIENDDFVEIQVADSGIGINEDNLDRIFEPFRQESEGLQRVHEGLGLGLFITKKLVEQMNGKIKVRSKPSEGTVVTVLFPAIDFLKN